ncbi:unnamed protein product [Cunninghamella echinulata]
MANSAWGVPIPEDKDYDQDSGSEYDSYESGSYSEDEGEEYGELQMSSWGNQGTSPQQTASFDVPITIVKAGEIGLGGLHCQGKNYKPVDEQAILNQRLKGTPVPGGMVILQHSAPKKNKKKPATLRPPSSSAIQSRLPLSNSVWSGSELASTPFWETSGSGASKYATSRPAATTSTQQQQQRPPHTFKQHAPQQQLLPQRSNHHEQRYQQQQRQSQQSQPSSARVSQPTPVQSTSKPFLGSASSKYANSTTTSVPSPAQSQLLPLLPSKEAILKLNIEIIPGISAVLDIYETNDYKKLVRDFGEKHHLKISEEAESAFAEKIGVLVKNINKNVLINELD